MDRKILQVDGLDEKIYHETTSGGIDVYFMPKEGYMRKYAIFATNYGSNDNKFIPKGEDEVLEVPEGIAHFLEHKLFEEPDVNIFDKFSKLGSDVNAYTSFNQTAYLFSTTDNFYESLKLLIKFVQNPYFTDENVEKEKGIIEQEIRMYEDNPEWRVFFNCLNGMYLKHPVKIDTAGTVDSIREIDKDILYKCYNTFYHPSNMVLFVVGDLSLEKTMEVMDKYERKDFTGSDNDIVRIYPDEPKNIKEKRIEENLVTSIPLFAIGFKDNDLNFIGKDLIKQEMTTNILLDMILGESSELYQDLYEEGLISNKFGAYYTGQNNYGHSMIIGESENPEKILEKISKYVEEKKRTGLCKDDFKRIKNKNMGYFLMSLNSIDFIANSFIQYYMKQFIFLNYLKLINEIEYEDILKRFNSHLTKDNFTLSIVRPIQ